MVERTLRVAVVGAQRARVAKVISLLLTEEQDTIVRVSDPNDTVRIEYLPCVATFDRYENEQKENIRYLSKVEYHGLDGKQQQGTSLAPFFDDDSEQHLVASGPTFPGVSVVAIGCGIEEPQDISMIETFVKSLAGQNSDNADDSRPVIVECVTPNKEYSTMKEEMEAYRAMAVEEKEEATHLRTLGPGKMAKFASSLAKSVVNDAFQSTATASTEPTTLGGDSDNAEETTANDINESLPREPFIIDPEKTRYACKSCRTILFGQDHLEDPPHVPMLHSFSRKNSSGASSKCASLFLRDGLDWMGDIGAEVEGKLSCPKCSTKLGHFHWAGTQCSCGTWVTPAIQVPLGKVDKVNPISEGFPPGTILSPSVAEYGVNTS